MNNEKPKPLAPVVSIYQNPDHVAGLVQQIFDAPLVTSETRESDFSNKEDSSRTLGAKADADGSAAVHGIARLGLALGGNASFDKAQAIATASRTSQSFIYSQAYYLNVVRNALRASDLLRPLTSRDEAEQLAVGDFVEYTATFSTPTIPSLLDVLRPELVAAVVEWRTRTAGLADIDFSNYDQREAGFQKLDRRVQANADLARGIAVGIQSDFRQEKTREYFGTVAGLEGVTAVTICDAAHFTVEDEDRILDGSYTVLGKVTATLEDGLPVFARNKILRNLNPDAVDTIIDSVLGVIRSANSTKIGEKSIEELLDIDLTSRVPGAALRVVPVAVFV